MTSIQKPLGVVEGAAKTADYPRSAPREEVELPTDSNSAGRTATKRALLIAPRYFGYEKDIAEEIKLQGISLDFLSDRPWDNSLLKAITRLRPEAMANQSTNYYLKAIEDLARPYYDYIVVVIGEAISGNVLKALRTDYPGARMIYYSWDSLKNKPQSVRHLTHYDRCLSFDPDDARTLGVGYRPLFFVSGFERRNAVQFDFDLSFVGTMHADRYHLTRKLFANLPPQTRTFKYLYLQAHWMFWARRALTGSVNGARKEEFNFKPLTKAKVQEIFMSSHAVLDIEHPNQSGLTMRTIESVGAGTKLITTNVRVTEHDFYNPENILVIDRSKPIVPIEFLSKPYRPIPETIYSRYRLSTWVNEVLSTS